MLVLLIEIAMIVFGLIALITGKLKLSNGKAATGAAARVAGIILLLPIPLGFITGLIIGVSAAVNGTHIDTDNLGKTVVVAEWAIVLACLFTAFLIAMTKAKTPPAPSQPGAVPPPLQAQNTPPDPSSGN